MSGQDNQGLTPVSVADHLEQDPPIRGQRYACISFVSPGEAIAAKDAYAAKSFVKSLADDVRKTLENIETIFEGHAAVGGMMRMLREKHEYLWDEPSMQAEYRSFRQQQAADIDDGFLKEHGSFKTNVHGFKIRGVYDSVEDAKDRAVSIKRFDNKFNVFVAEVGCWCPWSPSTDDIANVEYAETQLNTLMKKYMEGQDAKAELYDQRKSGLIEQMDTERAALLKQIQAEIFDANNNAATTEGTQDAEADADTEAGAGADAEAGAGAGAEAEAGAGAEAEAEADAGADAEAEAGAGTGADTSQ